MDKDMKTILISLLMLCCVGVEAQNAPRTVNMQVEEFEYRQPSAGKVALNVLSAVAGNAITTSDKSMVPQINEAVMAAASGKPWLVVNGQDAPDYRMRGIITDAQFSTDKNQSCLMVVRASIIDARTGSEVATKICRGSDYVYASHNMAALKAGAAAALTRSVATFIFEALPVTGTILQRGVEQANGKVKEDQCYVDLGTMHGIAPGMRLYITLDGKYKGELKVKEIMGDDLCSCKIVSGKSFIVKNLDGGNQMVVTSRPKKIKDE